ncbi:spore coat protein Y/spore coat protein Z [Salsuginibacillus halophilus]|uniref:Spore coat protein Y/spore coat protein Z n=1 Tax=Salsuginibacillus halophilus TaxID=517424 RepID=A0A2P8HXE1_9BACI|nr:CotY/CotZ family spore coat protein [Salsuginibacillus halophilus]PSL50896.1 spore coat protein Y/spore coat protein Z [Salsuginibacillus halophilus]
MSCGHHKHSRQDCVCDAVRAIKEAQDAVDRKGNCTNSCFQNLLKPNGRQLDTIPFMLKDKTGKLFWGTGGLSVHDHDVFHTVFFRVEHIYKDGCCATLSLLRPDKDLSFDKCCVDPHSLDSVKSLKQTGDCIEVDLNCFCAIQCLDPRLLDANC